MAKYRKKPVVIEAVQWTGENLVEVIKFTGRHPSGSHWTWNEFKEVVEQEGLKIFTLEGSLLASVGDWIIKGVKGEYYPCKPDIFEATYEKAVYPEAPICTECQTELIHDGNQWECPKCGLEFQDHGDLIT